MSMSCKPILRQPSQKQSDTSAAHAPDLPIGECTHADAEMTRVLKMAPRMASDPISGVIAHWKHDAFFDVVAPMADHVLDDFPSGSPRFERRTGKVMVFGGASWHDDGHRGRLDLAMGHSRVLERYPPLSSADNT